jgi:hypothetical protein
MKGYRIEKAETEEHLSRKVHNLLASGWEPCGGVQIIPGDRHQRTLLVQTMFLPRLSRAEKSD